MFQVNDRVLYRGWVYRVTAPMKIIRTMGGEAHEVLPVELVSADGDRSICGLSSAEVHAEDWWENSGGREMVGFMWSWSRHVPAEDAERAHRAA